MTFTMPEAAGHNRLSTAGHDAPVLGCMACQFDRQVYGIEIEFV
jgi:hypothetical protein